MRNCNSYPLPVRLLAASLAPVLGGSVLAGCSSGRRGPDGCLTTPVLSPVYGGSPTHKGVIVTIPRLGSQATGLDVGFRTASGQWDDSNPIPESFIAQAGQRVIVGIKGSQVQFRFAEVVSTGHGEYPALGRVGLSAQTTGQAQPWSAVIDKGVLPAWPIEPTTIPAC